MLAHQIDEIARARARVAPAVALASGTSLVQSHAEWDELGRRLVGLQEELDWRVYVAYGLSDADLLTPEDTDPVLIEPTQRAFEIQLARNVVAGRTKTTWFERHKRTPHTELPASWPDWYTDLVERRLDATESNPSLRLLEQPEYKRRWAGASWDELLADAVTTELLDRLEAPELWQDGAGRPLVRSAAQTADTLRHDERVRELLTIHTGSPDYDLVAEVGRLLAGQAVPGFAPLRYKPSGIEKFRAWQRTWELQREEDRGQHVDVPVPPKYAKEDFLKPSYWAARNSLDVPKERFMSFPGSVAPDDMTALYGWAGWDHSERGQAVARLSSDLARSAAPDEQIIPLLGVLLELQPWLDQWYDEIDARSGVSPASAISGATSSLLARLGVGADTVSDWRPAPATRGRKKKA
jgi:hypothetical protein